MGQMEKGVEDFTRALELALALQAAADGTGIVLGWRHLCKPKIDSGELVVLGDTSIPAPSAIYIMSEKEELLPNNVKALRDFLISKT